MTSLAVLRPGLISQQMSVKIFQIVVRIPGLFVRPPLRDRARAPAACNGFQRAVLGSGANWEYCQRKSPGELLCLDGRELVEVHDNLLSLTPSQRGSYDATLP